MRKLLLFHALLGLFWAVCSLGIASAGLQGPEEYGGHDTDTCEAATHASWYDPRNVGGQTVYDPGSPNGNNTYYVDDDPFAGFHPDGDYPNSNAEQAPEDCEGTPVLRVTAYGAIRVRHGDETMRQGFPKCSPYADETRNPGCNDERTGASGGLYVGTADRSQEVGYTVGVTPDG